MRLGEITEIAQGVPTGDRAAVTRAGPWSLSVVDSSDIQGDVLRPGEWRSISVVQTAWTEKRLLRPYDILITGRSQRVKVALLPPDVVRTVAAATLLVVRTPDPGSGLAHYLWYYLTSKRGRADLEARVRKGATIPTLSASALSELAIPLPSPRTLSVFPALVGASEAAYGSALEAARFRREILRDALLEEIATKVL